METDDIETDMIDLDGIDLTTFIEMKECSVLEHSLAKVARQVATGNIACGDVAAFNSHIS